MLRAIAWFLLVQGLAGCGEPGGARAVPVSGGRDHPGARTPTDSNVVTKDARAIATH